MLETDVVIAGGGVSGLLMARELSERYSVILLEQQDSIPKTKYWLTDSASAELYPDLDCALDCSYDFLDFIAYDGFTARIDGRYALWNTTTLIGHLFEAARARNVRMLMGHRLYSVSCRKTDIVVRANAETIRARLLVDCMGFGSPLVGAKRVADVIGYYIVHGAEVDIREPVDPVGLDNVIIDRRPTFFELFPTSTGTAHAAIIVPSRTYRPDRPLKADWNFIVTKSHYRERLSWTPSSASPSYFGIIPVGTLRTTALDRIVFFGESGQANPAASATGLTRMLRTVGEFGEAIDDSLRRDRLDRRSLHARLPRFMTTMNRTFQECLFKRILSFTSDDFKRLVEEMAHCPPEAVNDLIFGGFDFTGSLAKKLAAILARRPNSLLGKTFLRSATRILTRGAGW